MDLEEAKKELLKAKSELVKSTVVSETLLEQLNKNYGIRSVKEAIERKKKIEIEMKELEGKKEKIDKKLLEKAVEAKRLLQQMEDDQ